MEMFLDPLDAFVKSRQRHALSDHRLMVLIYRQSPLAQAGGHIISLPAVLIEDGGELVELAAMLVDHNRQLIELLVWLLSRVSIAPTRCATSVKSW
jgi:hypothetical protein